jgi:hypothetical protein
MLIGPAAHLPTTALTRVAQPDMVFCAQADATLQGVEALALWRLGASGVSLNAVVE